MKEALAGALANHSNNIQNGNNIDSQKGGSSYKVKDAELPREYEKMLQKLEADIRGHIRVPMIILLFIVRA